MMDDEILFGAWLEVITDAGDYVIDTELLGAERVAYHIGYIGVRVADAVDELYQYMPPDIGASLILDCELREGWCGRLSMSGYTDCTDWDGPYDTEVLAVMSLDENYGARCSTCEMRGCEGECGA